MLWFTCFLVTQVQGGSTLFIFNSSFLFCFFTTLVHLEIMSVAEGRCRLYMGAHAHKLTRESAHGFCWRGFPLFLFFFFGCLCCAIFMSDVLLGSLRDLFSIGVPRCWRRAGEMTTVIFVHRELLCEALTSSVFRASLVCLFPFFSKFRSITERAFFLCSLCFSFFFLLIYLNHVRLHCNLLKWWT